MGGVCVTADYRLAPELPYPAAIDGCYTALQWMVQDASMLDFDLALLLAVGISGGGGIAASLFLRCRHMRTDWPSIAAQVLIYPILDPSHDTVSSHQRESGAVTRLVSHGIVFLVRVARKTAQASLLRHGELVRLTSLACQPPL